MNNAIKKLLGIEPESLKSINEVFHIDYNKPFQAIIIEGKTTIKQILKQVETNDNTLILVLNYMDNYSLHGYCKVAVIDNHENLEIDYKPNYFHANKLSTYYTKGDFREHLKNTDISPYHIIIAQDKQFLTSHKTISVDFTHRYKVDKTYSYKTQLIDLEIGNSFETYSFDRDEKFLDKSGYVVAMKRRELKAKAKDLKAERDKAAFKAIDFSPRVEELRIRIKAKKLELIELLKAADTAETMKEVADCLENWRNGLSSIMESFEKMEKGIKDKSYPSIDDFNRHYNGISQMLINNGRK